MMTAQFNSIFRALAVTATLALAMPVFGQAAQTRVDIPLAFEVGKESMPAGQYTFERLHGSWQMLITDPSGVTRAFMTIPVGDPRTPANGKIVFEKLGGAYRLAEIHLTGAPNGVQIPATKAQIELAKLQRPEQLEVAMVRK
jgi:hypothetical protein